MDWKVIAAFIGTIAGGIKVYEFLISLSKAKKEKAEKEKQKARAILPIIQSHRTYPILILTPWKLD